MNIAEGLQDRVHEASVAQIPQSSASVQLDDLVIDAVVVAICAVVVVIIVVVIAVIVIVVVNCDGVGDGSVGQVRRKLVRLVKFSLVRVV